MVIKALWWLWLSVMITTYPSLAGSVTTTTCQTDGVSERSETTTLTYKTPTYQTPTYQTSTYQTPHLLLSYISDIYLCVFIWSCQQINVYLLQYKSCFSLCLQDKHLPLYNLIKHLTGGEMSLETNYLNTNCGLRKRMQLNMSALREKRSS